MAIHHAHSPPLKVANASSTRRSWRFRQTAVRTKTRAERCRWLAPSATRPPVGRSAALDTGQSFHSSIVNSNRDRLEQETRERVGFESCPVRSIRDVRTSGRFCPLALPLEETKTPLLRGF